ncbi:hypothetical protein [Ruicaihuangia caeni]|uniref:Uncharacterized protein n=1 Tax=Ruicaihuangia caeni TaxID=3042517 RepID=A0AAW6T8N6_9MICO|nr:hypothetical protein [Klugiella sp. YN-L-19]MDI2098440.1 hypothetical protein [Klugiella sp. YN-L-19]
MPAVKIKPAASFEPPDIDGLAFTRLSTTEWRVSDATIDPKNAESLLGLLEETADSYSLLWLASGDGPKEYEFRSIDELNAFFSLHSVKCPGTPGPLEAGAAAAAGGLPEDSASRPS